MPANSSLLLSGLTLTALLACGDDDAPQPPWQQEDTGITTTGDGSCPTGEALVPAGSFWRGDDGAENTSPASDITLSAYCMDLVEVTNDAFAAWMQAEPGADNADDAGRQLFQIDDDDDEFPPRIEQTSDGWQAVDGFGDHPVTEVYRWSGEGFCAWHGKQLPTEAQWEKAARGDQDRRAWPWGEDEPTCEHGNLIPGVSEDEVCIADTTPVGSYPLGASPYGMLDMAGNVAEWVSDWYDAAWYSSSPSDDPVGPDSGTAIFPDGERPARLTRGGAHLTKVNATLVYFRFPETEDAASNGVGFRCVRPWDPLR